MRARKLGLPVIAALVALATGLTGLRAYQRHRLRALPYTDRFAQERVNEWAPYGGHWHIEGNAIVGQAIERGAKLVSGSSSWADYQLYADVQLRGRSGDAGVVVRLADPGEGIETYRGYYAGLRVDDSAIVLGRSNGHWLSVFPVYMPRGVHAGMWYRIHVVAVGCHIAVEAVNLSTGDRGYAGLLDAPPDCIPSGQIGLRMTASGGAWRNVRVARANGGDLHAIEQHIAKFERPSFPIREREYNEMRQAYLASIPKAGPASSPEDGGVPEKTFSNAVPLLTVDALRSHIADRTPVRIVGVITSAHPLYIQDATAGVRLESTHNFSFQIGDQIDLLGLPRLAGGLLILMPLQVRVLWDRSPVDWPCPHSRYPGQMALFQFRLTRSSLSTRGVEQSSQPTIST